MLPLDSGFFVSHMIVVRDGLMAEASGVLAEN